MPSFLVWTTRTPAWPEQVSTATTTAFPPPIYHIPPSSTSVAQKYNGPFYPSSAVTIAKLPATACIRVRIRLNKKILTIPLLVKLIFLSGVKTSDNVEH